MDDDVIEVIVAELKIFEVSVKIHQGLSFRSVMAMGFAHAEKIEEIFGLIVAPGRTRVDFFS
ncbi:MAG: hypothetical protein WCS43_06185 [Verrucomicrobiota bacterium]